MSKRIKIKQELEEMERAKEGSLYTYIHRGMSLGTLTLLERRQAGLVAKNLIYTTYEERGSAWGLNVLAVRDSVNLDALLRVVMSSLLPQAQALQCIRGNFWMVDKEKLEKACVHAGTYHHFLYGVVEEAWGLRRCPEPWTTKDVRQYRKRALKAYKSNPSMTTARAVAVSLLPPMDAQIMSASTTALTQGQIRIAIQRCPSPTYEKAVEEYAYAIEVANNLRINAKKESEISSGYTTPCSSDGVSS